MLVRISTTHVFVRAPINSIVVCCRNLKFGYKGGTLGVDDIIIRHNELATINAEDISIGGN